MRSDGVLSDARTSDGALPDGVLPDGALPDAIVARADAKPDSAGDAHFMPPMPVVEPDPTLNDTTDFGTSKGFKIILDYRFDDAKFMTTERRKVLRTAAASWEQFIGSDFAALPAGTTVRARDPENTTDGGTNFSVTYPIDDVVVFVGSTTIDGRGGTLARAYSSYTSSGASADLAATLNQRYNGNPFQPWVATIVFDADEDAFVDGSLDSANDIPRTSSDLYSTALHELGHVLGTGQSAAYLAMVENTAFVGPKSLDLYGGPIPLASDGKHVDNAVLFDGRRIVMDVSDMNGQRSYITRLDLVMLQDLGYTILW